MNMGSTDSPPTYPLQNSFKEVDDRCWLAGAKAAAPLRREARTKDFIFTQLYSNKWERLGMVWWYTKEQRPTTAGAAHTRSRKSPDVVMKKLPRN
jgi:hypothetical protein